MISLKDLRAEVHHSEYLATRKVRRMARQEGGYNVEGTKLDPRKPKGWIDRATRAQLEKYNRELAQFRRPSVGWVRAHDGSPIRRQVIRNAEAAARRRNKAVGIVESRIADIATPWAGKGVTAGDVARRRSNRKRVAGMVITDEMGMRRTVPEKLPSTNYSSERAVLSLTRTNSSYLTKNAVQLQIKNAKANVSKMIDGYPALEPVREMINSLSDEQFWFAWSATPHLARALSITYEVASRGFTDVWDDVWEEEIEEIEGIVSKVRGINVKPGTFWV